MTPYEKLKTARASTRPTGSAYIDQIFKNKIELHGDRRFGDDAAIVSGVGFLPVQAWFNERPLNAKYLAP